MTTIPKPTPAFIGASWFALGVGAVSYFFGLFNATIGLGEKGYYVILMLFGLFAVVSLQKTVRDKQQGIPVTGLYYAIAWVAMLAAVSLMAIGLLNATFTLAEKGFYGMAFTLSLFAVMCVQKNTRDMQIFNELEGNTDSSKGRSWLRSGSGKSEPIDSDEATRLKSEI